MEPSATTSKSDEIGLNIIEFEAGMRHGAVKVNRSLDSTEMLTTLTGGLSSKMQDSLLYQNRERFYERAVKKKVSPKPPRVLGS